jgi:hypothetical protein
MEFMMLNEEQIEGHFREFKAHWKQYYDPQMVKKKVPHFEQGRMFQELWLEWKQTVEVDYLEHSGQLDL